MPEFSPIAMFAQASWVVQGVLLLLILLSVMSWVVIFNKSSMLRAQDRELRAFEQEFWSGAQELYSFHNKVMQIKRRTAIQEIFHEGCLEYYQLVSKQGASNQPTSAEAIGYTVVRRMNVTLAREAEALELHLPMLATIGSTSPYIGLFGTVWGIINAFHSLDPSQGAAMLVQIAPGISEALVATAIGLFAAIPAMIAYNRYTERVDKLLAAYRNFVEELTGILQRDALTK